MNIAQKINERVGKFFLAPAGDPDDCFVAGFDGNVFDSEDEARTAILGLEESFGVDGYEWVVSQY